MRTTRRRFIYAAGLGGLGAALPLKRSWGFDSNFSQSALRPGDVPARIAASAASVYRAYRARSSVRADVCTWVQIDLGSSRPIEAVRLYPYSKPHYEPGNGFPVRFRIECSDDLEFQTKQVIATHLKSDYPDPRDRIVEFRTRHAEGRYVRLTVTHLRHQKSFAALDQVPAAMREPYLDLTRGKFLFMLSKMEVLSEGVDIALRKPVTVDPILGNPKDAQQLTREPRPQGEGIVTDNPKNVTSPDDWRPAPYRAQAPQTGVELGDGLFRKAMESNIRYLLDSSSVDDVLRQFRQRAGHPTASPTRPIEWFWEEDLAGQSAGRFLMGAGNTLRWIEHIELRERMNAVIDGIAQCRQLNGYIMAYPEDSFFISERGAYTRTWVTHGLIDAGYAGNARAFELLRSYYDWYNSRPYLREALRGCNQGGQGMAANTRLYFTPAGRSMDVQIIQRYFQENYWRDDLAARRPEAIWQYPYDRPHAYLLTNLEAYLDLYRATGDTRYRDAVLGGWELFRDNWQSVGGSISIIEWIDHPPKSNFLHEKLGETCGSAFWILLNQRLHLLDPEEEKYVAEIEKSIYNVLLANQDGSRGIRYHTLLLGQKEPASRVGTCCEGQGTRILASLPEFIYSLADDGIYVNLFERSSIEWRQAGQMLRLQMETDFPNSPGVQLKVTTENPLQANLRIRTPSWASGAMEIQINGQSAAVGTPGRYVTLARLWSQGDTISFVLPIALKLTRYAGLDQISGRDRYALQYGPLLMAAQGVSETELVIQGSASPLELTTRLQPQKDQPLHFTAPLLETVWVPYFEVKDEAFSCFPIMKSQSL
jgi:DUF1680 family protein